MFNISNPNIIILPESYYAGSVGIQCFVGLLQELVALSFPLEVQYLIKTVTIAWQARHIHTVTNVS